MIIRHTEEADIDYGVLSRYLPELPLTTGSSLL